VIRQLFILLLVTLSLFASIGKFSIIVGEVEVERDNQYLLAKNGMSIELKDIIRTFEKSKTQLFFDDETIITLGKSSEFSVQAYKNDPGSEKAEFQILSGTFKAITGRIGKLAPKKFMLKTRTSTIGIRGTHFFANLVQKGDVIGCTRGEISVTPFGLNRSISVTSGMVMQVLLSKAVLPPRPITESDLEEKQGASSISSTTRSEIDDWIEQILREQYPELKVYKEQLDFFGKSIFVVSQESSANGENIARVNETGFSINNFQGTGYVGRGENGDIGVRAEKVEFASGIAIGEPQEIRETHIHKIEVINPEVFSLAEASHLNFTDRVYWSEVSGSSFEKVLFERNAQNFTTLFTNTNAQQEGLNGFSYLLYDNLGEFSIHANLGFDTIKPTRLYVDAKYYGAQSSNIPTTGISQFAINLDASFDANSNIVSDIYFDAISSKGDVTIDYSTRNISALSFEKDTLEVSVGSLDQESNSLVLNSSNGTSLEGQLYGSQSQGLGLSTEGETGTRIVAGFEKEKISKLQSSEVILEGLSSSSNDPVTFTVDSSSGSLSGEIESFTSSEANAVFVDKDAFGFFNDNIKVGSVANSDNEFVSWGYWQNKDNKLGTFVVGQKTLAINVPTNTVVNYSGSLLGSDIVQNSNNVMNLSLDFGASSADFTSGDIHFDMSEGGSFAANINGGGFKDSSGFEITNAMTQNGGDFALNSGALKGNYFGTNADAIGGTAKFESNTQQINAVFSAKK
jgi:hypothetical protein